MKKFIITLIALTVLLTSCFKDKMSFVPTDQLTPEVIFSKEGPAEAALLGVYSRFSPGWYYYTVVFLEAYGNKDWYPGANSGDLLALYETHLATSDLVERGYKRLWGVITYANAFIYQVQSTPFKDPERKKQAIAEARFLRALVYFHLVQLFGPVPLITDEKDYGILYPYNSTIEKIYQQIIEDLEVCVEILPEKSDSYEAARATKGAAKGILAKVLMTAPAPLLDIQRAVDLAKSVIFESNYKLLEVYDKLWDKENTNNSEQIFCAASSDQGSAHGIHFSLYASHDYEPTQNFYNSFDFKTVVGIDTFTDVRRKSTVYVSQPIPGGQITLRDNKYRRVGSGLSPNSANPNLYVLRLSDIILLRAEGLNKLGYETNKNEIFSMINMVRNRAGAVPADEETYPDQKSMALAIEEERHKELFFEFQAFFDLKRNDRLIEVLGKNGANLGLDEEFQKLWPLPVSELNKNKNLKQNDDY